MSRDFGRSAGATGQADGEDPPRMDGTSPSGQDGFAWPPREGDEPLAIELLDSTDRSLAYRDQFHSRKAADIHVVSEQPGPAAEPPLQGPQDRATHPIERPQRRVSYTYGHVFPAPVERPSRPVDPPAQPLKLFPTLSRARAIPLALVGVSLIAVLEGVYIWSTMRHSSGTSPTAAQTGPPATSPAATPQRADSQAAATATGTSDGKERARATRNGRLVVRSEPPGAEVSIDGRARGVTPMTLDNLSPGQHRVVLKANGIEVQQTVRVEAGATVSVVAPLKPRASTSGWIAIESPVEVDVFADGALVGTSRSPKILLQEGKHTLVLINESIGYRGTQSVRVSAGTLVSVGVTLPESTIQITAVPWAEVWVDGKSVGVTPIGKMPIMIGPHEVVFRHPGLGEKTVSTVVKAGETTSVTVDLTRQSVEGIPKTSQWSLQKF